MAEIAIMDVLSPRQYRALGALLSAPSVRQAAIEASIPEKTLYNWLRDDDFSAAYRQARRDATQQAIALLQGYSSAAARTLVTLMASGNPAAVRLAAASKVIDLAMKSVELEDLQQRLEALEARYAT